jgi:hypothetical protein
VKIRGLLPADFSLRDRIAPRKTRPDPDELQKWPWLVQLGQGRAGFYCYEGLENLAGCGIHNVTGIRPELQRASATSSARTRVVLVPG